MVNLLKKITTILAVVAIIMKYIVPLIEELQQVFKAKENENPSV